MMRAYPYHRALRALALLIALAVTAAHGETFEKPALESRNPRGTSSYGQQSSAVDLKGVRHRAEDYPDHRVPWMHDDIVEVFALNYPNDDRLRQHEGAGLFPYCSVSSPAA